MYYNHYRLYLNSNWILSKSSYQYSMDLSSNREKARFRQVDEKRA